MVRTSFGALAVILSIALRALACTVHVEPNVEVKDPVINLTACIEYTEGKLNFVVCPDGGVTETPDAG